MNAYEMYQAFTSVGWTLHFDQLAFLFKKESANQGRER